MLRCSRDSTECPREEMTVVTTVVRAFTSSIDTHAPHAAVRREGSNTRSPATSSTRDDGGGGVVGVGIGVGVGAGSGFGTAAGAGRADEADEAEVASRFASIFVST